MLICKRRNALRSWLQGQGPFLLHSETRRVYVCKALLGVYRALLVSDRDSRCVSICVKLLCVCVLGSLVYVYTSFEAVYSFFEGV